MARESEKSQDFLEEIETLVLDFEDVVKSIAASFYNYPFEEYSKL